LKARENRQGSYYFHTALGASPFIPHYPSLICVPGSAGRPNPVCRDVPLLVMMHQAVVADCPAIPAHERGCVRSMVQTIAAAIEGEMCQNSEDNKCHRLSPDSVRNDNSCRRGCRTVHGNRLVIPLRRILMGRKTRIAGIKRRDAKKSPLQPETTLI